MNETSIPSPRQWQGIAINFSNQSITGGQYPLVFGPQVAGRYTPVSEARLVVVDYTSNLLSHGGKSPSS
jgi:hypothetical protein